MSIALTLCNFVILYVYKRNDLRLLMVSPKIRAAIIYPTLIYLVNDMVSITDV